MTVFKNIDVLHPSFVPQRLPFRESEIKRIGTYLSYLKLGHSIPTLILYGKTGTGKTACIFHAIEHDLPRRGLKVTASPDRLSFTVQGGGRKVDIVYINAAHFRGELPILGEITSRVVSPGFRWRGHSKDEVYREFAKRETPLLTVIDEVDKLELVERDAILYTLSRESHPTVVGMVLISNRLEIIEDIEHRTLAGIQYRAIEFPIYSVNELTIIASQRAELALAPNAIEKAAIQLAAANAYQRGGDARKVIDYLRRAAEVADEDGLKRITTSCVEKAVKLAEIEEVADLIKDRVPQEKILLYALITLDALKQKGAIPRYSTVALYALYKEFAKAAGFPVFGKPAILRFVRAFELEDLVSSHRRGRGRGRGLDKFLSMDPAKAELLKERLEKDFDTEYLLDYYGSPKVLEATALRLAKQSLFL